MSDERSGSEERQPPLPSFSGGSLPEVLSSALGAATGEASGSALPLSVPAMTDIVDERRTEPSSAASGAGLDSVMAFPASLSSALENSSDPSTNHVEGSVQQELIRREDKASEIVNGKQKVESEEERKLADIYENFDFEPIWDRLSQVLTRLRGDPNAAQILLPLIESLMVISKHAATSDPPPGSSASARGSVSPSTEKPPILQTKKEILYAGFFKFTERHRKILNVMVRQNPSLMSGSFSLLVHNPKVLDFDNKRNYFTQQLHKGRKEHYTPLQLSVRREHVFADSFMRLQRHTGPEIKHGKLNVRFWHEEGIDAGGVTREWFSILARAMFNPDYALFAPCAADRTTYQPNRASAINPDHLAFFKFVGRVIGKAIYDGRLLDAYFTRSFYKHILGKAVDYRDLESIDPEYFKSLDWMLENDITDILDLTFSVDTEEFGETQVIDLKQGGSAIAVTEQNKQEYVRLVTEQRMTLSIRKQIDAFLEGFHDVIPHELIRIFTEQELELLISGLPDIDVNAWKNNTELHGYSASDPVIQWWWRAVRSFDQTEKAKLLQFITGTSKVPLEGFAHLQGVQGTQRFNIHKAYGADRLPAAHTCFNQLDLPQYESYEKLRSQLLLAMNEGGEGFGFA
ncbi:hypothetical protein CBS101457_003636 [Exobasidium rhododendri]|nr:hypothetical protein CBS101457_003636 [Exobasidium rhododendri]